MAIPVVAVVVQPPLRARPGMTLYPPVVAFLQSTTEIFEQLSGYWVVVRLVHDSDETLLGGRISDSAHPMPAGSGEQDRAYFYFPDLVISKPGRYCIRISLLQMDYSSAEGAVIVRSFVDTDWIDVGDSPIDETRPTFSERRFFGLLKDDGQHIPSAST